jgi:tetratricopeptide (TPR) repeat protein
VEMSNLAKKQIDLIRESICVEAKCMECRVLYGSGKLCFSMIEEFIDDRGKSCLFRLKEMSHELFRNSDSSGYKEKLYDMTVGYVFHEAMKLRENLYQIEYYRPYTDVAVEKLTPQELKTVREIQSLLKKSQKGLHDGLREIIILVSQLVEQMRELIKSYRDNYLLPRFLIESEKSLTKIYGRKGFQQLVAELWHGGRTDLFYRAGQSYLESEYYEQARDLFRKVADPATGNGMAHFLYSFTSAFVFYYRNKYTRARRFAEEAQALAPASGFEGHSKKLQLLIHDLDRELRRGSGKALRTGGR